MEVGKYPDARWRWRELEGRQQTGGVGASRFSSRIKIRFWVKSKIQGSLDMSHDHSVMRGFSGSKFSSGKHVEQSQASSKVLGEALNSGEWESLWMKPFHLSQQ